MIAVVLVVVFAVLGMIAVVLLARRQGAESTIAIHSEDVLDQRVLDREISEAASSGIDLDGELSSPGKPEPQGPPPVQGAQWDEVRGCWIRWDPSSNTWLPVDDPL